MDETTVLENKALRDSYDRVSKACEGLTDVPIPMEVENELGEIDSGMQIPLVRLKAGDTKRICLAVPPDKKTQIVKDLFKGTRNLPADLIVQQQSTCLHHLLKVAKPYIPAAVIAQPPPDAPRAKTPLEQFDEAVPAPEGEEPPEDDDGKTE